jgi:ribose 5-phosphate isomerase A
LRIIRKALSTHPQIFYASPMNPKQRAAQAAVSYVRSGMIVGLGTGSTADYFLVELAAALQSGKLREIKGVPTSQQSEKRAIELHIPLATLADCPAPDITIDGADEVDPSLNLIKGLGGALLREKIVAQNSKQLLIIADTSKTVSTLGERSPLPVEAAIFGHETHAAFLAALGCQPALRRTKAGEIFTSDNGNYIYDCKFPRIPDAVRLESQLKNRAGIIETGLFLNLARTVIIGTENGIETQTRKN